MLQRSVQEAVSSATSGVRKFFDDGRVFDNRQLGANIPKDRSRHDVFAEPDTSLVPAATGFTERFGVSNVSPGAKDPMDEVIKDCDRESSSSSPGEAHPGERPTA